MKTLSLLKFAALVSFCMVATLGTSQNDINELGEACGCPNVSARTTSVNLSTLADADGVLTAQNTVLSCDNIYIIDDKIYVGNGKSLTINPGTVLKGTLGTPGDANALIVSRGGQIFAPGTRECPILFTSNDDPVDGTHGIENKGQWGGVVLLGTAENNLVGGTGGLALADGLGFIEGFNADNFNNRFGADLNNTLGGGMFPDPFTSFDNDDNSGIMTFCSIRHAGDIAGQDNELNGLTLGSVGKGTTLSNIEIVSNLDDGIEFFGGTVDLKYGSVLFNDDDGFDWDLGWNGRGQFWVVVKTDQSTADGGDNGFECDGDDKDAALFYKSPTVYNATFVGSTGTNTGITNTPDTDIAMELKEGMTGTIKNCILANYGTAIRLSGETAPKHEINGVFQGDSYDNFTDGELILENNTFVNIPTFLAAREGAPITTADETTLTNAGNTQVASIAGFMPTHQMDVASNSVSMKQDLVPQSNTAAGVASTPPVDGFFTPVTYRGAFDANQKSWLSDYSFNATSGLEGNLNTCNEDINKDGVVDTNDFLSLINAFNSSCN